MPASLLFLHQSLQTLLVVSFPKLPITLRFHKHFLGRDVLVRKGSGFCYLGVMFRFSYSQLAD